MALRKKIWVGLFAVVGIGLVTLAVQFRERRKEIPMVFWPMAAGREAYTHLVFASPSAWYVSIQNEDFSKRYVPGTPVTVTWLVRSERHFKIVAIDGQPLPYTKGLGHGCGEHLIPCKPDNKYQVDPAPWMR